MVGHHEQEVKMGIKLGGGMKRTEVKLFATLDHYIEEVHAACHNSTSERQFIMHFSLLLYRWSMAAFLLCSYLISVS